MLRATLAERLSWNFDKIYLVTLNGVNVIVRPLRRFFWLRNSGLFCQFPWNRLPKDIGITAIGIIEPNAEVFGCIGRNTIGSEPFAALH